MSDSELRKIEEAATAHFDKGEAHISEDEVKTPDAPVADFSVPANRLGGVVGFSTLAAAMMIGGIFSGFSPRIYAALAGIGGIVAALQVRKIRNVLLMNIGMIGAVLLVGLLVNVFVADNVGALINPGDALKASAAEGTDARPPINYDLGWGLIVGWLMAGIGFGAAWVAIELRKPALGMLVPLPLVAFGAISVPEIQKVPTGLACMVLFAVGLGVLSGIESGPDSEQRSLAFELRRASKAFPMIGAITVALYFLAQTNFLFPPPLFDPTQTAKKPKSIPPDQVPDRVLFTVDSQVTGPWRMGTLDVYDSADNFWKLAPFEDFDERVIEVPETGLVDTELQTGTAATFTIKGLDGSVLPGLPNLVGMIAVGPFLAFDTRTGQIRLSQGKIEEGIKYTVTAAIVPDIKELRAVTQPIPEIISGSPAETFLEIPPQPPGVADLIRRAPKENKWDTLDFVRRSLLDVVVAEGQGTPSIVTPKKVDDMLFGSKKGSPYEIVAAQAMLARWVGVPSRIGYGFDGGDSVGGLYEVRPRHGSSFLEVYFPTYKWLPIIGNPKSAKSSASSEQSQDETIGASNEIAVQLFVPFETDPASYLLSQIRAALAIALPFLLIGLLLYFSWPILKKARMRARNRAWASDQGFAVRIAVAYSEWRDLCTDFGYRHDSDTPLMFLDRVVPDPEHTELAWLVTRAVSDDLGRDPNEQDAVVAEELARSVRKRMSSAHTVTLRAVASASRLSIRYPYAPMLLRLARKERSRARAA